MNHRDHTISRLHIGRASDMSRSAVEQAAQSELPFPDTRRALVNRAVTSDAVRRRWSADNTTSWKARGPSAITMPDDLAGFPQIPIGSLGAVMLERERQISLGHTPASDLANLDDKLLPKMAIRKITNAQEDIYFRRQKDWRRHAQRHLAEAAAILLAAWDRLNAR